ncbi:MAG: 23S rRNA (uridine2552-2'-O)-methyltransferase [Candidatus Endobugula sp.]|jgi:23S rRNA (uridine2552-2'-O)-methyltransferase
MARSKSSKGWLNEHFKDKYVQQSQQDGYRSRASYKLLEINKKDKLFKKNMTVIDLGSAPGGWSQVAAELVGDSGTVVASDILSMDGIAGVDFVQGDFTETPVFEEIMNVMQGFKADLVISDMAPNMSGMTDVDQPRSMHLVELALDMAVNTLTDGGTFITKVFQGEGFDELLAETRKNFSRVVARKPDASRARSREVYWVATGFKGS